MISLGPAHVGPSAEEADERKILRDVSFASSLGSLADRIVLTCLRLQAQETDRLDEATADEAIQLLENLVSATTDPVHVIGRVRDVGALSFLTSHSSHVGTSVDANDDIEEATEIVAWLHELSDALRAARDGTVTEDQLDLILSAFTRAAEATLSAASKYLSVDHSGSSWKIAIPRS